MGIFTSERSFENGASESGAAERSGVVHNGVGRDARHGEGDKSQRDSGVYDETDRIFSGSRGAPEPGLFEDLRPAQVSSVAQGERALEDEQRKGVREKIAAVGDSLSAHSYFNAKGAAACGLTVMGLFAPAVYFPALLGAGVLLGWGADSALAPIFKEKGESKGFDIKRKIASWIFTSKDSDKSELSEVGKFLVEHDSLGPKVLGMVTLAGLGVASGGILGMASIIGAGATAYFVSKPGTEKPLAPRLAGGVCLAGMAAAYIGMPGLGLLSVGVGLTALVAKPLLSIFQEKLDSPPKEVRAK